jgi:hypothetical protein
MQRRRNLVGALGILVATVALLFACKIGNSSSSKTATKVTAEDLIAAYDDNEVAADKKYKGKWVKVTGIVGEIKKDILNDVYVTIGTGKQFEFPVVQCFVAKGMTDDAADLKKGQKITAKGRVDGLMMNVLVRECSF